MKLVNRILSVGRNAPLRDEVTAARETLADMNDDARALHESIRERVEAEERRIYARHTK